MDYLEKIAEEAFNDELRKIAALPPIKTRNMGSIVSSDNGSIRGGSGQMFKPKAPTNSTAPTAR